MVFDKKITLLQRVTTANDYGEQVVSFSTIVVTFAEKVYKRGGEQTSAAQQVGFAVEQFRIRYRSGLTQVNALTCDGNHYEVKSIMPEGRNQFLILECEKKDSQ